MFNINFNKLLLTLSLNISDDFVNNYITVITYPMRVQRNYYISNSNGVYAKNANILNCNIILGTGNTTPTETDYTLSGTVISLTNQTTEVVTQGWNKDCSMEILYKVTGTPTSDTTISEIGLVKNFMYNSFNTDNVLLAREVLDTPIELTNGVAVELYFKLKFKLT